MKRSTFIIACLLVQWLTSPVFGQVQISELIDFVQPVGNWVLADQVQMDVEHPETLSFDSGSKVFVNGEEGKAKYLITKDKFADLELHVDFMIPKNSNSGIYFQCRYEIQIFDSWQKTDVTYYDCGGIQDRYDKRQPEGQRESPGFAPLVNACKAPGSWQTLDVVFRAPKFDELGNKIKNAMFERVELNGKVVQRDVELSGPTRGALSQEEVNEAPFRLQGGHGPVGFRNLEVKKL